MTSVNKRILEYIRSNDISLSDVAKKIGVAQSSLSRTLSSDDLKISQLIEITKALELSVTYFFDGKEHISNAEIEGDKKRIAELEEMLKDKRYIIEERERVEIDKTKQLIIDVFEKEFKHLSENEKAMLSSGILKQQAIARAGYSINTHREQIITFIHFWLQTVKKEIKERKKKP